MADAPAQASAGNLQAAPVVADVAAVAATAAADAVRNMTDAFMERLLANKEAEKDKDKVGLPSWEVDPHQSSAVIEPWPGASYTIPEDLVELVKRGIRPPLVWLTVEALVGAEDGKTRKAVTFCANTGRDNLNHLAFTKDCVRRELR